MDNLKLKLKAKIKDCTVKKPKIEVSFEESDGICYPISELGNLWTFTRKIPTWIDQIIEITPRSNFVVKNTTSDCHIESNKFISSPRLDGHSVPRTLVCHDMKGGYLEDKFIDPVNNGNGYTFYRWAQIDVFVYFSHHLVTIPPLSWINIAHSNGVKILGTFITEWIPGKKICQQLFASDESVAQIVDILVNICIVFKLDGWLLNIENPVENVDLLKKFVQQLTEQLHIMNPRSLVIWYDSVINNGKLEWQNELNGLNKCFFDSCDGIFLNYSWNEDNLQRSAEFAEHRRLDVYVGVDVFGRNFYGGGNFNTYLAAQKIRENNLSMAIFAQGWTHETLPVEPKDTQLERFFARDNIFWQSLWQYLYTHPINTNFQTFFYTGVDKEWFNLRAQEKQLSRCLHSQERLSECNDIPTLSGCCNCLQLFSSYNRTSCLISKKTLDDTKVYVHQLFICDISIDQRIIFYYYCDPSDLLNIILLVKNTNQSFKKIICCEPGREVMNKNCSVMEVNPIRNQDINALVASEHDTPKTWKLMTYLLHMNHCRILEIGAEIHSDQACLYGIGFKYSD